MRTLYCSILLLFTICISASCTEKAVTQDPNATGAVAAKVDKTSDPRLAQKVTYQSGHKRLHNVTDELTTMTGVTIYAGESSKNWQVRDIPLVVCVKDMPLGKLLDVIADTTHTAVTSFKPEGNQERSYRIYRTRIVQKGIDNYFTEKDRVNRLMAEWNWNAIKKLKDIPDSEFKCPNAYYSCCLQEMKLLSAALADLGPDAEKRYLTGEYLRISGDTPMGADLIKAEGQRMWHMLPADSKPQSYQPPTEEELAKTTYGIQLNLQDSGFGCASIKLELRNEGSTSWSGGQVSSMISELAETATTGTLPKRPNFNDLQAQVDALPSPDYQTLQLYYVPAIQEVLKAKIKIELPKEITEPGLADVLQAVAKASGYDIIVEDFLSHHQVIPSRVTKLANSETTLLEALRAFGCNWMLDEKSGLIIGWYPVWQESHANLVAESLLTDLQEKLNGPGVELDDLFPIVNLTPNQGTEWIINNKHLRPLNPDSLKDPDYGPLWLLYSMLDETRQTQARSEAGLQLAGIDQTWLHSTLSAKRKQFEESYIKSRDIEGEKLSGALADPDVLRTLTLRVKQMPQTQRTEMTFTDNGSSSKGVDIPPGITCHTYAIELAGEKDGTPFTLRTRPLYLAFPIYSPEREKEILQQSQKKD